MILWVFLGSQREGAGLSGEKVRVNRDVCKMLDVGKSNTWLNINRELS